MSKIRPQRPMGRGRTKSMSHAIEHPYLVVPHPKNVDHPLCVKCGKIAASTLVVPAPGSIPEWPACKGMFPTTHCQSCATSNVENEYVYEVASCGCGVTRSTRRLVCPQCYKEENESRECDTEGCREKRHGNGTHCKSCYNLSRKRPMTCFLCGEEITRNVNNTKGKKNKNSGNRQCIAKDNNDCFRRCNAYKGGVRGGEGGDDSRCQRDRYLAEKRKKYTSKTCGQNRCLIDCTLLSE